jgi:phosphatidate cytidylyltransferase
MGNNQLLVRIVSGLLTGGMTVWIILDGGFWLYIEIMVCSFGLLSEWVKINRNRKSKLFVSGVVYIAIPMSFWFWYAANKQEIMTKAILWILTIVSVCDTFAFFGGKLFGGPKLAPQISPNKTWSGVVVGSVLATIASLGYLFTVRSNGLHGTDVLISVIVVIVAVFGDLLESKVKRLLQIKDTGAVIPGHGGVCDRLDSFLLASYAYIIIQSLVPIFGKT